MTLRFFSVVNINAVNASFVRSIIISIDYFFVVNMSSSSENIVKTKETSAPAKRSANQQEGASSPTTIDKKQKTAPIVATSSADDGEQTMASISDAAMKQIMAQVEEKFVSKQEVEEKFVSKQEVEEKFVSKQEVEEKFVSKQEVEEKYVTKEDHAALTARLNNITTAFHPATQYALFEMAIYECVDKKILDEHREAHASRIKDGVAALCRQVLVTLLSGETTNLAWTGPSTRRKNGKEPFPKDQKRPLVLGGLAGLAVYIKHQSQAAIKDLEHSKRNELAHNGPFLQSIYQSPDGTTHFEHKFVGQKESVKRLSMTFKDEAEKDDNFRDSIQEGVSLVVAVLKEKLFLIETETEEKVVEGLKNVVS